MKQLKIVREKMGLSQRELADIIGCTKGQLAMAEIGRRQLPEKCRPLIDIIEQADLRQTAKKTYRQLYQDSGGQTMLDKILRVKKIDLEGAELRKEDLEDKIAEADLLIAGTTVLASLGELSELARMQATLLQRQSVYRLQRYRERMMNCELQIAGLQAVINKATSLKNN